MLSMVISLYEARGALPRNIAELYAAASRAMAAWSPLEDSR